MSPAVIATFDPALQLRAAVIVVGFARCPAGLNGRGIHAPTARSAVQDAATELPEPTTILGGPNVLSYGLTSYGLTGRIYPLAWYAGVGYRNCYPFATGLRC